MKALRGAEAASHEDEEGDGTWLLGLLKVKELEPSCVLSPLLSLLYSIYLTTVSSAVLCALFSHYCTEVCLKAVSGVC